MNNAFDMWMMIALKTNEMMNSSAKVISKRVSGIALSVFAPNTLDLEEVNLMGLEKQVAVLEVTLAVVSSVEYSSYKIMLLGLNYAFNVGRNLIPVNGSLALDEVNGRNAKIVADSIKHVIDHSNEFTDSAARIAADSLEPLYQRTQQNAQRLSVH